VQVRPIYGFLDFLHVTSRLSSSSSSDLTSSRTSLILSPNITSRLTYHAGTLLSNKYSSPLNSTPTTIEQFGFYRQLDHVLLDYLNMMEVETAKLVIDYVLSSVTDPTTNDSQLAIITKGLEDLAAINIQVWGGIRWDELEEVRSGT